MNKKIKVWIIGLWNCASSLIQGIWYYSKNKSQEKIIWLINNDIWWYTIDDIEVVSAIDVNVLKIWKSISKAIYEKPNCTKIFTKEEIFTNQVIAWPILDWISKRMDSVIKIHDIYKDIKEWEYEIVEELINKKVDVLISYLPVWSKNASIFYANCALKAKVAFANAIPEFICSTKEWSEKFKRAWIPCAWDDIKSQFWATILHRSIVDLINKRGLIIDNTYQLNIWWNTDFENMKDEDRLESKRISKTEAVTWLIDEYQFPVRIWPSDFIPHLDDNKICYINLKWKQFWDIPFELDIKLSVEDSPNSAWVMIDVIRLLKLAQDRWLSWYQDFSTYYFKHPVEQIPDSDAYNIVQNFIKKK